MFEEKDVSPLAMELAEPLSGTDDAKAAGLMEGDAGGVLGEDAGLDRPEAGGVGSVQERAERMRPMPFPRCAGWM